MSAKRKKNHYIDGEEFSKAILAYQEIPTEDAMEEIIDRFFRPLASGVAKAFFTDSLVSYEDLEADALLGCWQAIGHFKPGRKKKNGQPCTAFEYFTSCARNEVRAGFRTRNRLDVNNNKLIERIQDGTVHPSKLKGICAFHPPDTDDDEDEF